MAREAPDREYRRHSRNFRRNNDILLTAAIKRVVRSHRPRGLSRLEILEAIARSGVFMLREELRRRFTRPGPPP
jgi:hypothetical protein